jgi:hypothetical protein
LSGLTARSNGRHATIRRERTFGIGNQIPIVLVCENRGKNVKISTPD